MWLGKLADLAGAPETDFAGGDWAALLLALPPELASEIAGPRVRVALNGAVIADKRVLRMSTDDEVAFLPPVSGG